MIGPEFPAVLSAAARGDEDAFGRLWHDLQPRLLRYFSVVSRAAAEDLASETWLGVVRGLDRFQGNEAAFRATLERLTDLPIVGDVRGGGFFYGIELVKDKATKQTFDDAEAEKLLRGFLSKALFESGLYCRADDRGDPVIQLSPPLICGQEHFDEIEQKLRSVLDEAWTKL